MLLSNCTLGPKQDFSRGEQDDQQPLEVYGPGRQGGAQATRSPGECRASCPPMQPAALPSQPLAHLLFQYHPCRAKLRAAPYCPVCQLGTPGARSCLSVHIYVEWARSPEGRLLLPGTSPPPSPVQASPPHTCLGLLTFLL